jgi:ABC-type glycerol-3-phosphate transport system substrate-binding protein
LKRFYALSLLLLALLLAACAGTPKQPAVSPAVKQIRTVYIWDADGHTDLSLLRGLKEAARKSLKEKGLIVTDDPNAAQAYVKVTVIDAGRDADAGKSHVRARLYLVDATDGATIYDMTAEAHASGGGDNGPAYPMEQVMEKLLSDYPKMGEK